MQKLSMMWACNVEEKRERKCTMSVLDKQDKRKRLPKHAKIDK